MFMTDSVPLLGLEGLLASNSLALLRSPKSNWHDKLKGVVMQRSINNKNSLQLSASHTKSYTSVPILLIASGGPVSPFITLSSELV